MNHWAGTRVLVTGGFGFIGSALVEKLTAADSQVTVADDFRSGNPEWLSSQSNRIEVMECDILSNAFLRQVKAAHYDYVFHLASTSRVGDSVSDPMGDFENTLKGSLQLIDAIRLWSKQTVFIFPSSAAVYGNPLKLPMEENDPICPISPYGVSKLSAERYLSVYSHLYQVRGCSLRFFSVYGPRQKKLVVYDFIKKLLLNPGELKLSGDGSQKRDFVFVSDVVDAFMLVGEKGGLRGEVYNVASGHSTEIIAIAQIIARHLNINPRYVFDEYAAGDPDIWIASIEKIRALGFCPKVDINTGIKNVIDWVLSENVKIR